MIEQYDPWLANDGPVAVVYTENLEPAQCSGGVVFPPTFAPPAKGEAPYYVIDDTREGKVALIDSVGSQANRMEPIFKQPEYASLIPKAKITVNSREIDLLDAGHRAADALVRFSNKREVLQKAFQHIADSGNSAPLARLAPTSLVFGVWDSRGTGVKLPRIAGATIRAYDVEPLTRAAQYFSVFEKDETDTLGQTQDFLSELGLSDAPAGRTHGGILARKAIVREALLNLVALRSVAGGTPEETTKLQRYVLGLALAALTAPWKTYLREGCLLVSANGKPPIPNTVGRSGVREPVGLDAAKALSYATLAAKDFVVGADWTATFEAESVTKAAAASKAKKAASSRTKEEKKAK
jgi:CRISPR-associated protein Csb1